jgi:hypothetical protein
VKDLDSSGYRLLFGAILVALAVAVTSLVYYLVPGVLAPEDQSAAAGQSVQATVVQTAKCSGSNPMEKVQFTSDGRQQNGQLDACNHPVGTKLQVVLPAGGSGTVTQPVMEKETILDKLPLGYRDVAMLLLGLAGVAGGCYGLQLGIARPVLAPRSAAGDQPTV